MNCPVCNVKAKCNASRCHEDITARRYTCPICKKRIYTLEQTANKYQVMGLLRIIPKFDNIREEDE